MPFESDVVGLSISNAQTEFDEIAFTPWARETATRETAVFDRREADADAWQALPGARCFDRPPACPLSLPGLYFAPIA